MDSFYKFKYDETTLVIEDIYISDPNTAKQSYMYIGKDIFDYFEEKEAQRIYSYYLKLKKEGYPTELIYSEDGIEYSWIFVKIYAQYMTLGLVNLNRLEDFFLYTKDKKNCVVTCDYSIYIRYTDDYKRSIMRYSKTFLDTFNIKDLDEEVELSRLFQLLQHPTFYERLRNNQAVIVKYTIVVRNIRMPSVLEIKPQNYGDIQNLFIRGYRLDRLSSKSKFCNLDFQYKYLYQSSHFGFCTLKIVDKKIVGFGVISFYLEELLSLNYASKEQFYEHPNIHEAIINESMRYCSLILRTKENRKKKFKMCVFPIKCRSRLRDLHIVVFDDNRTSQVERSESLTKREDDILYLAAMGETNRYIAEYYNLSEGTIKKTIYRGYKKLNISSRLELAEYYKRRLAKG